MNAVTKLEEGAKPIEITPPAVPAPQVLAAPAPAPKKRRGRRLFLMLVVPLAMVAGGGYFWLTGGRFQETDNANLRQPRVTISSEAAGRITDLRIADNATVKAGDVLFVVEQEPYRIALAQADAAIGAARLGVEQLRAAWSQAVAQERVAAGDVAYLQSEFDRAVALAAKGVGTQSSLESAKRDLAKAKEQHLAALESVSGALAGLGGDANIPTDKHPSVLAALAARDKAQYQLGQTTIVAPADGIVSQAASVKIGQFVTAGTPLFTLVETGDTWVEANFKETQLTNMKLGQEATVTLDAYPGKPLKAVIDSIGAGTGAEFSLLPAQNATGNWVKVTQRIPVRLKLNADDAKLLVRTGMSAAVAVDTEVSRSLGDLFGTAQAAE